jgi:IS30 family transposase
MLRRPAPSPLRTGRDHRRAHMRFTRQRRRFEEPMLGVHQRPFPPEDRSQPGHWPRPDSFQLRDGLLLELAGLPAGLLQSITWDQGSEMARHLEITAATGAAVYFCDAGSPWQRGTTKTPTGFCANTFRKELTCPGIAVSIFSESNANSINDQERSSKTGAPSRSSLSR